MISSSTFHVITTELTVGMFALSGVAFLYASLEKANFERERCTLGFVGRFDSNTICNYIGD